MLHEFIDLHRDEIIRRCRTKVALRSVPAPTRDEIDHGVPLFLSQLGDALRLGVTSSPEISRSATLHGRDLLHRGFTISQVVHDYGDVCQSVMELALDTRAPIGTDDFRLLNGCLDDAIAGALTEFGREMTQATKDAGALREQERVGFFAHELRNLLNTAMLSFQVIKSGNVGVAGSTGAILHRSLRGASELVARSLAEVRLARGNHDRQAVALVDLINAIEPSAMLAARAAQVRLSVLPVDGNIVVEADPDVLSSVILNLIQNAVKFTRPATEVALHVNASDERVRVEIHDECGGLPEGNPDDLFGAFEQRGTDRSGMGLGLAFSRRAIEASNGRIYARDVPGHGCVFTIELPRHVVMFDAIPTPH